MEEDPEDYDLEYGFGTAKHFMPLPNTVVGSHCAWELRLNTVQNRIPGIMWTVCNCLQNGCLGLEEGIMNDNSLSSWFFSHQNFICLFLIIIKLKICIRYHFAERKRDCCLNVYVNVWIVIQKF